MRTHPKPPSQLYTSRDHFPWLRRTVATISTWFALAGYTLFALIFTSNEDNLRTSRRVLTALAGIFLILGYSGAVVAFFLSSNPVYRYDSVIYPFLLTSFAGLMEIVLNHALHKTVPVSDAYIYPPLVVAIVTTLFSAFLAATTLQRIERMKHADMRMRNEIPAWETHSFAGHDHDPGQATELLGRRTNMDIPEDEAQRQQLLRLLIAKEQAQRQPTADTESTYRIDWPGDEEATHLVPPQPQHTRPRSGSAPSISDRWKVSDLLGSRAPKAAVKEQPSTENVRGQREERRREIERQSLSLTPTTSRQSGLRDSGSWGSPPRR